MTGLEQELSRLMQLATTQARDISPEDNEWFVNHPLRKALNARGINTCAPVCAAVIEWLEAREPERAPRPPLSRLQQSVLDCIADSLTTRGFPPTVAEIGTRCGIASKSSVAHQLMLLELRGYITREPNTPRAITLIQPTPRSA